MQTKTQKQIEKEEEKIIKKQFKSELDFIDWKRAHEKKKWIVLVKKNLVLENWTTRIII